MSSGTTYPDTDEEELSPLSSPAGSGDNTNAFRSSQAVTAADTQMSNTAAAALLQPAGQGVDTGADDPPGERIVDSAVQTAAGRHANLHPHQPPPIVPRRNAMWPGDVAGQAVALVLARLSAQREAEARLERPQRRRHAPLQRYAFTWQESIAEEEEAEDTAELEEMLFGTRVELSEAGVQVLRELGYSVRSEGVVWLRGRED